MFVFLFLCTKNKIFLKEIHLKWYCSFEGKSIFRIIRYCQIIICTDEHADQQTPHCSRSLPALDYAKIFFCQLD